LEKTQTLSDFIIIFKMFLGGLPPNQRKLVTGKNKKQSQVINLSYSHLTQSIGFQHLEKYSKKEIYHN